MNKGNMREYVEIIGIAAVIVSIVLLTYEIRQTRQAIMGQTILTRVDISTNSDQALRESGYLARIYTKVQEEGVDSLTSVERESLTADLYAAKTRFSGYYYQYELGLMDEDFYQYDFLPNISYYKPLWIQLDVLAEENTRPSFREVVHSVRDYGDWSRFDYVE